MQSYLLLDTENEAGSVCVMSHEDGATEMVEELGHVVLADSRSVSDGELDAAATLLPAGWSTAGAWEATEDGYVMAVTAV